MENPPYPTPVPAGKNDGIINPNDYDQAAAYWLVAASDPAGTVLAQSFVLNKKDVLASLNFQALQIARLVSTVGAATIKARFLIMYDERAQPHFTLALFATDALDKRVSSYYLADRYWLPKQQRMARSLASKPMPVRQSRVRALARYDMPNVLTDRWVTAWSKVTRASTALFATSYGPLRGYSYGVEEFISLLRDVGSLDDENIILEFDLHDYYQSQPQGDVLVHTFGLLLWTEAGKMEGGDEGVNMGNPCPPLC
ncbi:hypothetical protein [Hymenobacter sp. UYCo722]|uniref:hypothetical protein n=1 Tax=Hymenobacter sp. UYCo722 TaxID=3156335 RepID=UPI003392CAC5